MTQLYTLNVAVAIDTDVIKVLTGRQSAENLMQKDYTVIVRFAVAERQDI